MSYSVYVYRIQNRVLQDALLNAVLLDVETEERGKTLNECVFATLTIMHVCQPAHLQDAPDAEMEERYKTCGQHLLVSPLLTPLFMFNIPTCRMCWRLRWRSAYRRSRC
jgi:hypothetical protein